MCKLFEVRWILIGCHFLSLISWRKMMIIILFFSVSIMVLNSHRIRIIIKTL